MRKLLIFGPVLLAGCTAFNTAVVDPALKSLAQLANTSVADLQIAENVANAATPTDTDGYNCAVAAVNAIGYIQKVNTAATAGGTKAGVFTAAEMTSLFQPGSAQYKQVTNLIASGCIAKANDVLGAANVLAAGGVMAVLPQILPLAAAP